MIFGRGLYEWQHYSFLFVGESMRGVDFICS